MRGTTRLLATAAVILPQAALAQGVIELDEAFVFSGLLPVEVNRTGSTVDVIEGEALETGAQNVEATLDRLPGVNMNSNGGIGTQTGVNIRGLSDAYVGVTINGIEVGDPSSTQSRFNFGTLVRGLADRVEVVRGPQTAIYGSDAIGGSVNLTTWRPEKDGWSSETGVEAGSFGTWSADQSLGFRGDGLEAALTFGRFETDGISSRNSDTERDGFTQSMATFYIARDVSEALTFGATALITDGLSEFDQSTSDPDGLLYEDRVGGRVFAKANAGGFEHEVGVSTYEIERYDPLTIFTARFTGERKKLDYKATGEISEALSLAFGADWTEERAILDGDVSEASNGAVFGEVNYALTPDADLSVALRHDAYSDFADQTTGRAALVWRLDEATKVRAVYGTGYRAPSLYERFGPYAGTDLQPEKSYSAELGVETVIGATTLGATAFYNEIMDKIDFDYVEFDEYLQTEGRTVAHGVELEFATALGGAELFGSYTYTDGKTPPNPFAPSDRLRRVPRHDLTIGVEGALAERLTGSVALRAAYDIHSGSAPMDDYAVVDVSAAYDVSEGVEAYVRVENLFDRDYESVPGYNMPGRAIYAGLRASF